MEIAANKQRIMAAALPLLASRFARQEFAPETPENDFISLVKNDLKNNLQGLKRGAITEILGPASSGRTALLHALLAASTSAGEVSAIVDCNNAFDPASARDAGAGLERLLWVQCNGRLDHAMKAVDLILHGGGFGLVALDLCEIPLTVLQRIPLSYWHRFRLAVANTPSALVVVGNQANAKSCAVRQLELAPASAAWPGQKPFQRLSGRAIRLSSRKPVQSESATLWVEAQSA
jgi:hypothetical protein